MGHVRVIYGFCSVTGLYRDDIWVMQGYNGVHMGYMGATLIMENQMEKNMVEIEAEIM